MVMHTPWSGQSALVVHDAVHIAEFKPLMRLRKVTHRGVLRKQLSLALQIPYEVLFDELHAESNRRIRASRRMTKPPESVPRHGPSV